MKSGKHLILCFSDNDAQFHSIWSIVWCVHLIQVDTYRNLISQSYWNHKTGYLDTPKSSVMRVTTMAVLALDAESPHRVGQVGEDPLWKRLPLSLQHLEQMLGIPGRGGGGGGGCCSWLCHPAHPRGSQSGWDRDCMLATPFCWRQTTAGSRWPPLPCGGERCHPGRQPSVLSAAV